MRLLSGILGCLLAALVAALALAAVTWRGSDRLLRPEGYANPGRSAGARPPPADAAALGFAGATFPTAGGRMLSAWLASDPHAEYAVVLVHGEGRDRLELLPQARILREAGYAVLLPDLSDHGASDGAARGSGLGFRELHDVSAAVGFLKRERGLRRVAAFGTSLGGNAVLLAAAGDPSIDFALAECPFSTPSELGALVDPGLPDRLRSRIVQLALLRVGAAGEPFPIHVVAKIAPTPLVLFGSAGDRVVSAASVQALFGAAREPKQIWIAPKGAHDALYEAQPEEYRERLLTYTKRWLGPHGGG